MNQLPLVSVICLCHNQAHYVAEAIASVKNQSYPKIELIVVDDGSTDDSKACISDLLEGMDAHFINLKTSIGNCAAFNRGFRQSTGAYIIDLAADDLLLPERVLKGINSFLAYPFAGVSFCDVMNIDANGHELGGHYERDAQGRLREQVPQGDVYVELVQKYFISPPAMMIKREVLEELNGYDESLSYEDFDFWIRSARKWPYTFTDEILVKKRLVSGSLSDQQFRYKSRHQVTTLKVCRKIKALNNTKAERKALKKRCIYEIKQCIRQGNFQLIPDFLRVMWH